jgi:hypothetical protein
VSYEEAIDGDIVQVIFTAQASVIGVFDRCGLAIPHKLAGVNPAQVITSHEPGIESCRHIGNDVLGA